MSLQKQSQGFTLIELLVVIAVIGLLLSIVTTSLLPQRVKARDTRRISDMRQVKTGMDLYYSSGSGYPDSAAWGAAGTPLSCNATLIMRVPDDPAAPLYNYVYTPGGPSLPGCGATVRTSYQIRIFLERQNSFYTMDEEGIFRDSGNNVVSVDSLL